MLGLITEAVDIPAELLPGMPLIELTGHSRVMVDNHRGISEYTNGCICVRVSFGLVSIYGCGLRITKMRKKQIVIGGNILRVELEKGREK